MKKQHLLSFIQRYYLGSSCESVKLVSDGTNTTTSFITEDKNVVGMISRFMLELEAGEYHIYDTSKLISLLNILDGDIRIKVNKHNDTPFSWTLSDGFSKVTFILSDPVTIPEAPKGIKKEISYDMKVMLQAPLFSGFIKAQGALSDAETFSISSDGYKAELVLGKTNIETNRVAFDLNVVGSSSPIPTTHFSSKYLREILSANKDSVNSFLEISKMGIAHLTFDTAKEPLTSEYYLMRMEMQE